MDHIDELLSTARAARARGDWLAVYGALTQVRSLRPLDTDDLHALADAAWWLGRTKEMLSLTELVHRQRLERGQTELAAMDALELGMLWMIRGDVVIGSGWVNRSRRILGELPAGPGHGYLLFMDAMGALEHDTEAALSAAREMQSMAGAFGDPNLSALGILLEGLANIRQGRTASGFALIDEAMLPVVADQIDPGWAGNLYCTVIGICHELGDLGRMRAWTEATERWCERFSSAVMFVGICRVHRLQLRTADGLWDEVETETAQVCAELEDLNVAAAAEGYYQLGEVRRRRGNWGGAEVAYARARELGMDPQPGEALLQLAVGRSDAAWNGLSGSLEGRDRLSRARLLQGLVDVALARGLVEEADRSCAELEATARDFASPGFTAWGHHARGAVLLGQDRPAEALLTLRKALREYGNLRCRYETAEVHLLMAQAHRQLGEPDPAATNAEAAREVLEQLDASAPAERGPLAGGLTRREAEVLHRIATGETNREAAAALHISEKTVGRHLANIFVKLDVSSRTAAAAWAHEQGLAVRPDSASNAPSPVRKDS